VAEVREEEGGGCCRAWCETGGREWRMGKQRGERGRGESMGERGRGESGVCVGSSGGFEVLTRSQRDRDRLD
jgi:hypothetical protein